MAVNLTNNTVSLAGYSEAGDGKLYGLIPSGNTTPTGLPTITGTEAVSQTLTCVTSGIADADGLGSFAYQWKRGGVDISGETSSTYTLAAADEYTYITVAVSYTDGISNSETLTSASTGAIQPIPPVAASSWLGIPDPSWDLASINPTTESRPTQPGAWPSAEAAGYYYIDNTHGSATDTANTYGYPDKPRLTIPSGTYAAGAFVEIAGGPYTTNQSMQFEGTAGSPIWVVGDTTTNPTMEGRLSIGGSSYVILSDLDFNGGSSSAIEIAGAHDTTFVCLRDSKIRNKTTASPVASVGISPANGYKAHDIVIYNNDFSSLSGKATYNWDGVTDLDHHGITASTYGRDMATGFEIYNIWALANTATDISGNFIQWTGQSVTNGIPQDFLHHLYAGGNTAYDNRQGGFACKSARHVVFSQNVSHTNRQYGTSGGFGDGLINQYGPDMIWWIFNEVYASNYGYRCSDGGVYEIDPQTFVLGNVFYDIQDTDSVNNYGITGGAAMYYMRGSGAIAKGTRYCAFNTVYSAKYGLAASQDNTPLQAWSNIFYPINTLSAGDHYHVAIGGNMISDYTADNNLFADEASFRTLWAGSTTDTTFAAYKTTSSQDANSVNGSADYTTPSVSPGSANFALLATSAAIEAGSLTAPDTLNPFTLFNTTYGIDILKDFTEAARTSGTDPDCGAYEYVA